MKYKRVEVRIEDISVTIDDKIKPSLKKTYQRHYLCAECRPKHRKGNEYQLYQWEER